MNQSQIFDKVNQLIINEMEKGNTPWRKPWASLTDAESGQRFSSPCNFVSKRPYSGMNSLLLGCSAFDNPFFLTFNQIKKLKGKLRKGAEGMPVIFWKISNFRTTEEGKEVDKQSFLLKYYHVFNIADTNIDFSAYLPVEGLKENVKKYVRIETCESLIDGYADNPELTHDRSQQCYYQPGQDRVNMVRQHRFTTANEYYCTYFHELIHSTGHRKRLNRDGITSGKALFGSKEYSQEELVAEIGASYLCHESGIQTPDLITNSAAYLAGWLRKLKEDEMFFYRAAKDAEKAFTYITGERE